MAGRGIPDPDPIGRVIPDIAALRPASRAGALRRDAPSAGRLPENDSEIVLTPALVSYSKKQYSVGDKIKLSVGDRVLDVGDGNTRSIRYESELFDNGERINEAFVREYTFVGIRVDRLIGWYGNEYSHQLSSDQVPPVAPVAPVAP